MGILSAVTSVPQKVLALVPSEGLGGGIESYVRAAVEGLEAAGAEVSSMVLRGELDSVPLLRAKLRYTRMVMRVARGQQGLVIIAFHAALAPVAALARRSAGAGARAFVVQHGWEIWTAGLFRRRWDAATSLHQVAVSSFSAGALAARSSADVLHPGIPMSRYERLIADTGPLPFRGGVRVLSVFRLAETESKGGYCLVEACRSARENAPGLTLVIAGRGPAPARLREIESATPWLTVMASPSDEELDQAFRSASLFVLATRTRRGRGIRSGEGFGIVLIEAALAGLPVIAPASGGSFDAYLERITGLRPRDESPEALAELLALADSLPDEFERLGGNGRTWARAVFDPNAYAARVADVFLGRSNDSLPTIQVRDLE